MDALGGQKDSGQAITAQEAASVVELQANHTTLDDDVMRSSATARAREVAGIDHAREETVDGEHGRITTRTSGITSAREGPVVKDSWAKLHSESFR
jgi:hypothetical protein